MGTDAQGKRIVLREGDNEFVCRAGRLTVVADPPQCSSTKSKPTITYMLGGATQRSISNPDDKTSPALAVGPHWMIMMRFDPKTSGIPETYSDTGRTSCGRVTHWTHAHHGSSVGAESLDAALTRVRLRPVPVCRKPEVPFLHPPRSRDVSCWSDRGKAGMAAKTVQPFQ